MKPAYSLIIIGTVVAFATSTGPGIPAQLSQPPTENEEDLASNIDWADQEPNVVVADDFIADGRPITGVRWWGSNLTGATTIDGWLISFHEPLDVALPPDEPLGLYFCATEDIQETPTALTACDAHPVLEYTVSLTDCCLIHANADDRSDSVPAQPAAFSSEVCFPYDLAIQAVVGHKIAEGPVMGMPTLLGTTDGNSTHSMWSTDDGKFVVTGEERSGGGIHVHEIIDNGGSLTLIERDSFALPANEAFSVHNQIIIGNRLYCSWYQAGLRVFDIDPVTGALQAVTTFDTADDWGVYSFLGDDKILLSDIVDGFLIVDIATETLVGSWDEYAGAYSDLWADGDFAYVPNWPLGDGNTARIHILDISNPANPTLANTFFLPAPNTFSSPQDVKVGDGLLFIGLEGGGSDGVAIVDVRTPPAATLLATVRVPGFQNTHNVFYHNGFLYMAASGSRNVGIVDLTNFDPDNPPPSPITTARWILTNVGDSFVHDITVKNDRLYVAAWNSGLWIYDLTNVEIACVETDTANTEEQDFWGWHSTANENGLRPALMGTVTMGGDGAWLYGPWTTVDLSCGSSNMAFELLTLDPDPGIVCNCTSHQGCDDSVLCTFDQCLAGVCSNTDNTYGDVDHNGMVDVFDLFCILNAFSGDFEVCSFEDVDIDPCGGNGKIDLFDLFAVLNAFSGADPCCDG